MLHAVPLVNCKARQQVPPLPSSATAAREMYEYVCLRSGVEIERASSRVRVEQKIPNLRSPAKRLIA